MPHVFQTDFPADECRAVAEAILGRSFTPELIRSGWVVAEYAVTQLAASAPVGSRAIPPQEPSADQVDAAARTLLAASDAGAAGARSVTQVGAVAWLTIAKVVLKLILEVLA